MQLRSYDISHVAGCSHLTHNSDDTLAGFLAPVSGARKQAPETMTHFAGK